MITKPKEKNRANQTVTSVLDSRKKKITIFINFDL